MGLELSIKIPNEKPETVKLNNPTMLIGSLESNHVVIHAHGVDPIHAIIEENDDGSWSVTDLGSGSGVKVDGSPIDVESRIQAGNVITIGTCHLEVKQASERSAYLSPPPIQSETYNPDETMEAQGDGLDDAFAFGPGDGEEETEGEASLPSFTQTSGDQQTQYSANQSTSGTNMVPRTQHPQSQRTVRGESVSSTAVTGTAGHRRRKRALLFSPRTARPSGNHLEVVAYWDDVVLDVEHFHYAEKDFGEVIIGTPPKAHLIAAGKGIFDRHALAKVVGDGYKIKLTEGMTARVKKGGQVEKIIGPESISLSRRDVAHVNYGAVNYFFVFITPPDARLPRTKLADPFFGTIAMFIGLLYCGIVAYVASTSPVDIDKDKSEIWGLVNLPELEKKPEPVKEPPKPKQEIKEVKVEPPKPVPPPPKPVPPKPATPIEAKKPEQVKPVEKPVEKPNPNKALANAPVDPKPVTKPTPVPPKPDLNQLKDAGMASTNDPKPDFKNAGPKLANTAQGAAGGAKGAGNNQAGGARQGAGKADMKGVEGVNNNKPSGVNLSKLGLGAGKILNTAGAGAIHTQFKDSAGGAGGGMGSAAKTYGLGGVGNSKSLGLAGANNGAQNFGSGSGGFLSGDGGKGGLGGAGLGKTFGGDRGRAKANVSVPPGDPLVSGGLTAQEVLQVIRANLNQIRHCYEQLLQRSPNASGKVGVNFVVGSSGSVSTADITSSSVGDARMEGCITSTIRRWRFPQPRGGQAVTVNYPFVFNPI